ncbi:levanase/fructan beta-fructosidase [Arachidicoccus rhizosphaerae]|uniref:Levanase/fructan beta-fructosidase n=1 Tax=Arachidicoccus rhizosphaerae TaxID=551991 RepID=A0A1H4CNC1_9BACT|nr:GH32 C-terminal domain-containing protein [Arachidicoccus rhizosphaerae]SEA61961.1 levanase/fructan beta-fructosidase [Arachidicoccus rhizosphaerae]
MVLTAPLKPVNGQIKIQVLLDKSSLEVFGNDGERVITTMLYPDDKETGLSVFAEGKAKFEKLRIWNLENRRK